MRTGGLAHQTIVLVIVAYLFAALPHMGAMPPWLIALVLSLAVWRAAVGLYGLRRPGWLLRSLATFGGLGLVIVHFGTLWGRQAATVMLCVMIAAKLSEMFRLRDARVVATLCYFLITAQFLFDQGMLMFGYLLIGCWLTTAALVRIQRDEDRPNAGNGAIPVVPALRTGVVLLVLAAPFALTLFFLFPRLASPLWGMPENALDARTGLSDEMSPGAIANLYADDSPAFRVSFDGSLPERDQLYWRGPVLWHFDGRTWTRLQFDGRRHERQPGPDSGALSYRVQLEPSERRWMFALDYPVRAPEDASVSADFELLRERPVTSLLAYDMISQPDFVDTLELSDFFRRRALNLPADSNPRTVERAKAFRREYADDRALVDAVLRWFNQEDFFYSLETAPLGRHGADEFLFDLRVGYCEYYASAFTILMRAAGIPARIVTGYQGGFWQAADEYLLVRQSDAHAWVEVWFEGRGWTRVDPTAAVSPSRVLEGARTALGDGPRWFGGEWLFSIRNQYDRLHRLWNDWVLAFDSDRQENLLQRLGLGELGSELRALALIAVAALAIVPIALLMQLFLRSPRDLDPLHRAWLAICRRLGRAGIAVDPSETPREIAARAAPRCTNGDQLEDLAGRYQSLRYGPDTSRSDRDALAKDLGAWRPSTVN